MTDKNKKSASVDNEKKLTDWVNEPSFAQLKANYDDALPAHEEYIIKLEKYRLIMQGGKPIPERRGRSTHRPLIARKFAEWKIPMLTEPILNTKDMFTLTPKTADDELSSPQNESLINFYWETKVDKVRLTDEAARCFVEDGTVIGKDGWTAREEEVEVEQEVPVYATAEESYALIQKSVADGQMSEEQAQQMLMSGNPVQTGVEMKLVEESKLVENNPTYEICPPENIILDPTCNGDKKNLKFLVYDYETDISELLEQEFIKETRQLSDGSEEVVNEGGVYHNLDKIKGKDSSDDLHFIGDKSTTSNATFYSDTARKKLIAHEYWGEWDINGDDTTEQIVATWVNGVLIRLELNPYPHKEIPFSIAAYLPVRGSLRGEPDSVLIDEHQAAIGRMGRAITDMTATKAVGQKLTPVNLFPNASEREAFDAGENAEYNPQMNPSVAIHQTNVENIDNSMFQYINLHTNDVESLTGTKSFSGGMGGGSYGAVAENTRSVNDATSKRELGILRRFTMQLFNDMGRRTIVNQQVFASQEETIRITGQEYATIRREDLRGEFDLTMDITTPESDAAKIEQMFKLMQTNAASMDPNISKLIYGKMLDIWNEPLLAKLIKDSQPTPDPVVEEMNQIRLQAEKLKLAEIQTRINIGQKSIEEADSKIVERVSRAEENAFDRDLKSGHAKAHLAMAEKLMAEAEKMRAEANLLEHDLVSEMSGDRRELQELDNEFKAIAKLDEIKAKASSLETNNIGEQI